ncbi:MAG: mandelate racemase/muconate lactonizing enzyme family protein [Kiritimatiellae bacterium]|nr:mandelate racemase/muconate lactonizing enzyme family protein [Kiritimatiellia bacterium]
MRITNLSVEVRPRQPSANPIRDALQTLGGAGTVDVKLETDTGVTGTGGIYFGRLPGAPDTLAALIRNELEPLVVGADPERVRLLHQEMLRETEYHGSFGLAMFGIAAVDIAVWDCLGKAHGVPCWKLWGGLRDRVPVYAMCGWLNHDESRLRDVCRQAVEQGFKGVKIKVGCPTLAEDVQRVKIAREAIGDEMDLMVDANQALSRAEALRRGRAFEALGCTWWEESIRADDIDGYAELAAALAIPVATGENLYTPADFARFLKRDAVDIVQPDLRRAGGPTALLSIGLMAHAFGRPYASHGGGPVQLNVMACLPNALYLETGLRKEGSPMKIEAGHALVPNGPGFGWG